MWWKARLKFILPGLIMVTLAVSLLLGVALLSSQSIAIASQNCPETKDSTGTEGKSLCKEISEVTEVSGTGHRLALIVPFRDRFEELLEFIPHMKLFLNEQNMPNTILVVNQGDTYRFNRASLVNAGYKLMLEHCPSCDYFGMHDVDLLPMNPELKYSYPEHGPLHLAAPHLHPKYHYAKFVGGILLLTRSQFELVDGMSNRYWGWGLEDDEFYVRLTQANITVQRPGNLSTDSTSTFRHIHNPRLRKRDYRHCYDQKKVSLRRDYESGLHNVNFTVAGQYTVTSNGASAEVFNVHLRCDRTFSPWCLCPEDILKPKTANSTQKTTVQSELKKLT